MWQTPSPAFHTQMELGIYNEYWRQWDRRQGEWPSGGALCAPTLGPGFDSQSNVVRVGERLFVVEIAPFSLFFFPVW